MATPDQLLFGGDRPVYLEVPADYVHSEPTPLVILLHGYGANAFLQTSVLYYRDVADRRGVLFAAPEGTSNDEGKQFWNATDACCDKGSGVDDVEYLGGLIDEISAVWNVAPDRIYFIGHSNGGYMSHRMACDREDVAAIVSLAGATWMDPADCAPTAKTSILEIHGTGDDSVLYEGGAEYPSARGTVSQWAELNGCGNAFEEDERRIDLDEELEGQETRIDRAEGCPTGLDVELWTIEAGSHVPKLSETFEEYTYQWMADHPKVR